MLEGKTAVVTGARRGIGAAVVERFASLGAAVIFACARTPDADFEARLRGLGRPQGGPEIIPVYFDLSREEQIRQGFKAIRARGIPVDILVNCAGALPERPLLFSMTPLKGARGLFETNFWGQLQLTQLVARLMQAAGRGSVVFFSSVAAQDGYFATFDYVSSKAALNGAVRQLSRELGQFGVRVNAVAPGVIASPMTAGLTEEELERIRGAVMLGRLGTPEEAANLTAFLASDLASYITGQIIRCDGGLSPPRAFWN